MTTITTEDPRELGVAISQHFDWDGVRIMQTAAFALEDANFHLEARTMRDLLKIFQTN